LTEYLRNKRLRVAAGRPRVAIRHQTDTEKNQYKFHKTTVIQLFPDCFG